MKSDYAWTWLWTGLSWNNHSEILNITLGVPLYYFRVKLKNFNFNKTMTLGPWFYERWLCRTWLWTGLSWNNHSEILNITLGVPLYYFGVKLKNFNFQQNHDLRAMVLWKVIMVPTWLWTGLSWNNHSEILNITLGVPLYYFGVKSKNFNFQQNHGHGFMKGDYGSDLAMNWF